MASWVTTRRMVLDLGTPAGSDSPWRLKMDFMQGEPMVFVALHWGDKLVPTHVFEVELSEIREALEWARRRTGEE